MKNILVVDDEREICWVLSEVLKICVADSIVFMASNGKEAMRVLDATRIDILLTDLNMPGISGFELIAYAKEHHPKTKIIVMSGTDHSVLPFDNIPYIRKPFNFQDISNKFAALS